MSHFSVVVFSHDGDYDTLLAPYSETDEEYFHFEPMIEDCDLESKFEEFKNGDNDEYKDKYATAEEWMTEYYGYIHEVDAEAWGYMCNPDAKWDWYQEYGRLGERKLKHEIDPDEPVRAKDLDTSVNKIAYDNAIKFWNSYVIDHDESCQSWFKPEYYKDRYESAEDYALSQAVDIPYACITPDGVWHETGSMGWFGMDSTNANQIKSYREDYLAFVKSNPNCIVDFIDCHI